jgi:hypothetical protein
VKVRLVLGLVVAATLAAGALGSPASAVDAKDRQLCIVTSDDPAHRDTQTICITW